MSLSNFYLNPIHQQRCTDGHADFWRSGKLSRSMQRVQILGGTVGDFVDTQIGAPQPAHSRRPAATLGVGMSASR